jgi:hypothetical protein
MNEHPPYDVIKNGIADTSQAPRGKDIFYRCTICGGVVSSIPPDNVGCACGNVFIDVDYARLSVRDYSKFQAVRRIP